jgi:hypothetical protein
LTFIHFEKKNEGEGIERWIWCKYCVHNYVNRKMRPVKTSSGMGEGVKDNDGGGEFNYDIL